MTKRLFWKNPYKKEFEATILGVKKEGVILDQTLFHPEGGGQASDRGVLKKEDLIFNIDNVYKQENEIIHHITSNFQDNLNVGEKIIGNIDWEYRYGLMKAHSSQHIFSAVILRKFNTETTRVNIDFEDITLCLAQKISYNQLKSAFQETNEICSLDNHEIVGEIISFEDAEKISKDIRGDLPKEDQIRLVRAENCDLVCCSGTHVQNSIEIGPLIIYSFKKEKDIKYFVGNKAIKLLSELDVDLLKSAKLLGQPINKIHETIEKQTNIISKLQQENIGLEIKTIRILSKNPITTIKNSTIYILEIEMENKILNKEFKNFPSNSLLIITIGNRRIRVLSKSQDIIANDVIQYLIGRYGGKGGGSNHSAQCILENRSKDLLNDLKEFISKK
ncbi:MAG: alanyl-tRNA editing protein [Promethearchaeota archaeon]